MCVCSFPSEAGVKSKSLVCAVASNAQFQVFYNMFFEEVCLSLYLVNRFHLFEWISDFVMVTASKGD
jgi:hypothetical protein